MTDNTQKANATRQHNKELRDAHQAAQNAAQEAIKAALLSVVSNPSARPGEIVRASEMLLKMGFYRENRFGGDTH